MRNAFELAGTVQKTELNEKADSGHIAAGAFHQLDHPTRGSACCQQIVDDQHAISRLDRIHVHLQAVGAVFKIVGDGGCLVGELAGLADGMKR